MISVIRPNIKSAWQTMPSAGTGTKDDPLYWNETGQAQEGYFYIDLPSTGGEYESSVDAWVYGKFEANQAYEFRFTGMDDWGLQVKVYNADNTLVATGAFDEMEYVFALEFEPEATGIYYFNITCPYVMGDSAKIGVSPAPVAITPYIERTKGKAETLGFNEQGRAVLYSSIKQADLGLKTVVYAAGQSVPTGTGYETSYTFKPLEFLYGLPISEFVAYNKRYAFILENGDLFTFGKDNNGHGNNSEELFVPKQIEGKWRDVSLGSSTTFALNNEGEVWGWGTSIESSLLGRQDHPTPVKLFNGPAIQVQGARNSGYMLAVDKRLTMWGSASYVPKGESSDSGLVYTFDMQCSFFCRSSKNLYIINNKGELFSSGVNQSGMLGREVEGDKIPIGKINNDTDWCKVYAIENGCFLEKVDGSVYGIGKKSVLGVGESGVYDKPTELPHLSQKIASLGGGASSVIVAIRDEGLHAVGENPYGCLGTGGTLSEPHLTAVGGVKKPYKCVASYFNHDSTCFVLGKGRP